MALLVVAALTAAIAPTRVAAAQVAPRVAADGRPAVSAGTQFAMPGRPFGLALSPDGRRLLVTGQAREQSLTLVDVRSGRPLQRLTFHRPRSVAGAAVFTADGSSAYVAGGGSGTVRRYTLRRGRLVERRALRIPSIVERDEISRALTSPYPVALALSADERRLIVADELGDAVHVMDVDSGASRRIVVGDGPVAVTLERSGRLAFVANGSERSVSVIDIARGRVLRTIAVGWHPAALESDPAAHELYVANADGDSVSVIDTRRLRGLRRIRLAAPGAAARGRSPVALALDRARRRLYVAAAADNAIDVVALARGGRTRGDRRLGTIPAGEYPAALALEPRGTRLLVANAKGALHAAADDPEAAGTLSRIALSADRAPVWRPAATAGDGGSARGCSASDATMRALRGRIDHVVYVLKENRAYDEIYGSRPRFGADVVPNHRALARRFVRFDDLHALGAVSPDGKAWSLGAFANSYVERNWPATYAFRGRPSDYLGSTPASATPQGQLWDSLRRAGRSFRNYGVWASGTVPARLPRHAVALRADTDANFPGYSRRFSDQRRAGAFLTEFRQYERRRTLPDFIFLSLSSDHLLGTRAGYRTPAAMMADNDLALGRIVDAISHSRFWRRTAIFVLADDAQGNGGGESRTVGLVISPYTQRSAVDSTRHTTLSMLATMEAILGLPPLSRFDAAAAPMSAAFDVARPDWKPYRAIVPRQSLSALNPGDVRFGATFALGVAVGVALGVGLTAAGAGILSRRRRLRFGG